jgi:hypothetical protein
VFASGRMTTRSPGCKSRLLSCTKDKVAPSFVRTINSTKEAGRASVELVVAAAASNAARHGSDPADGEIVRTDRINPLLSGRAGEAIVGATGLGAEGAQPAIVTNVKCNPRHKTDPRTGKPIVTGAQCSLRHQNWGILLRSVVTNAQ